MKLTREEALKLHRQMWTDMQEELGDDPEKPDRICFKRDWCSKHFNLITIEHSCFLCEYARFTNGHKEYDSATAVSCKSCPIKWVAGDMTNFPYAKFAPCECYNDKGNVDWRYSPISAILALPEREVEDEVSDN